MAVQILKDAEEALKEEGLENVNLFNFGYTSVDIQGKLYQIAYPVYKRFIHINPYSIIKHLDYYDLYRHVDSLDILLEESRENLDIVLEKATETYKKCGAPAEYIEALVLIYLLNNNYKGLLELDVNKIIERLSINSYIEFLDREPNTTCVYWNGSTILNKDVIKFGLQQKFSDLLKNIKIDLEPDYKYY